MATTKEVRRISKQLFSQSFTEGRLDENKVATVAKTLAEKKPRHYLDLFKEYQRLVRLEVEKHQAIVESATALDKKTRDQLSATLRNKYGADLATEFKVSPDLIGGLRIKISSDVWDSSVRGRLDRLSSNLASA